MNFKDIDAPTSTETFNKGVIEEKTGKHHICWGNLHIRTTKNMNATLFPKGR